MSFVSLGSGFPDLVDAEVADEPDVMGAVQSLAQQVSESMAQLAEAMEQLAAISRSVEDDVAHIRDELPVADDADASESMLTLVMGIRADVGGLALLVKDLARHEPDPVPPTWRFEHDRKGNITRAIPERLT